MDLYWEKGVFDYWFKIC